MIQLQLLPRKTPMSGVRWRLCLVISKHAQVQTFCKTRSLSQIHWGPGFWVSSKILPISISNALCIFMPRNILYTRERKAFTINLFLLHDPGVNFISGSLISSCLCFSVCLNQSPQLLWLEATEIYCLTAGKIKAQSRCPQGYLPSWGCWEDLFRSFSNFWRLCDFFSSCPLLSVET